MHVDARYNELIYGLTKAGEKALKEAAIRSDWVHSAGGPLWHQRMVAQLTAELEIDCRRSSDRNYIQGWKVLERAQTRLRGPVTFTGVHAIHRPKYWRNAHQDADT